MKIPLIVTSFLFSTTVFAQSQSDSADSGNPGLWILVGLAVLGVAVWYFRRNTKTGKTARSVASPDPELDLLPAVKSWDFGTLQPKITVENGILSYGSTENKGSYPLSTVQGIQYTTDTDLGHFIILASGGTNEKVSVPKGDRSRMIVSEVNQYILEVRRQNRQA